MPNEAENAGFSTRGSSKAEEAIDPGAFTAHQLSASQRDALSLTAHIGRQAGASLTSREVVSVRYTSVN